MCCPSLPRKAATNLITVIDMSTGKKFDNGKSPLVQGCMAYFPDALNAVADVSKYGAEKYQVSLSDKNWRTVEGAKDRYLDAAGRHLSSSLVSPVDDESTLLHLAHHAWNALAVLQLELEGPSKAEDSNAVRGYLFGKVSTNFFLACPESNVNIQRRDGSVCHDVSPRHVDPETVVSWEYAK